MPMAMTMGNLSAIISMIPDQAKQIASALQTEFTAGLFRIELAQQRKLPPREMAHRRFSIRDGDVQGQGQPENFGAMVLLRILLELVQVPLGILLTAKLSTAQAIADFRVAPALARSRL